jgi:hypothetical protein
MVERMILLDCLSLLARFRANPHPIRFSLNLRVLLSVR